MKFLIISMFGFVLIMSVILLSNKGKTIDGRDTLIRYIKEDEEVHAAQLEELEQPFIDRVIKPVFKKISVKVTSSAKISDTNAKQEKHIKKIKQTEALLRKAGVHTSYENYKFIKIAFAVISPILSIGLSLVMDVQILYGLLVAVSGILLGFILPDFLLKSMVKSHQAAIKRQLPDVMDLMGVCMEAGLSFDAAIAKIAEKMEGPFVDELMTAFKQMQMGVSRSVALNSIADCSDINELKTLVSALIQASVLGIPITNIIAVQSKQLRNARREDAREKGNKAPVKITIPIILLIFPALVVVVLGPSILNLTNSF